MADFLIDPDPLVIVVDQLEADRDLVALVEFADIADVDLGGENTHRALAHIVCAHAEFSEGLVRATIEEDVVVGHVHVAVVVDPARFDGKDR